MKAKLNVNQFKNKAAVLGEAIRVNHAGEYAAVAIYKGQIAALANRCDSETIAKIRYMREQEECHLRFFEDYMLKERIRPSLMLPLWNVLAYGLGYVSADRGDKAAMTCTVAVEEVIDEHYARQEDMLKDMFADLTALREAIKLFRSEENEHKDSAALHGTDKGMAGKLLSCIVSLGCRAAIKISKKI